jgi:hypothetical protein
LHCITYCHHYSTRYHTRVIAIITRSENSSTVDNQSIDPGVIIRWRLVRNSLQLLSLERSSIFVQYSSFDNSLEVGTQRSAVVVPVS